MTTAIRRRLARLQQQQWLDQSARVRAMTDEELNALAGPSSPAQKRWLAALSDDELEKICSASTEQEFLKLTKDYPR